MAFSVNLQAFTVVNYRNNTNINGQKSFKPALKCDILTIF